LKLINVNIKQVAELTIL